MAAVKSASMSSMDLDPESRLYAPTLWSCAADFDLQTLALDEPSSMQSFAHSTHCFVVPQLLHAQGLARLPRRVHLRLVRAPHIRLLAREAQHLPRAQTERERRRVGFVPRQRRHYEA